MSHYHYLLLQNLLKPRLSPDAQGFLVSATKEIIQGVSAIRVAQLLSLASRYVLSTAVLAPQAHELSHASSVVPGWNPEHWSLLETLRGALLCASPNLGDDHFASSFEHCFRYADHGELCALYRILPLLPQGERFIWRAGEGCRSNMRSVFEAVACDSPYPARYFDDSAWHHLVIKALFLEVPLSRVVGFTQRRTPELARMALDMAEERKSAGRTIPSQLWRCLSAGETIGEQS